MDFRKFLAFFNKKTINDLIFGEMEYDNGLWYGVVEFHPTKQPLEICIEGDTTGPFERLRNYYQEIVEKYTELEPMILPKFKELYSNSNHAITLPFEEEFPMAAILLLESDPVEWELTFEPASLKEVDFSVRWMGWEIEEVIIED